jgi:hypothetical protein
MQNIYIFLALGITSWGYMIYYKSIEKNITESNIVSWILWTIIGSNIMLNILFSSNDKAEIIQGIILFLGPLFISVALYRKGKAKWGKVSGFEKICISWAIILLISIIYFKFFPVNIKYFTEIISISIIILDFIVFLPLLVYIFKNPETENPKPWIIWIFANPIAILAIEDYSFAAISFLLYMTTLMPLVAFYIIIKTKQKKLLTNS